MNDIKFRYVIRFAKAVKKDGKYINAPMKTDMRVFSLDEIENDEVDNWLRSLVNGLLEFMLVSRDMYIGVKDGNGNEIYENDLVEYNYHEGRGIVTWDDEDACFFIDGHDGADWLHLFHDKRRWHKLEVVGNVHQDLVR